MDREKKRQEIERRIEWSFAWVKRARPMLHTMLNGGDIIKVEGVDNEVCRALDMVCGTDYICVYPTRNHAWGIACRVQKYDKANFTVRKKLESGYPTEFDKRRYAIAHNGIYPYLTMQMFVDEHADRIRRIGIARTVDIISAIDDGMARDGKVRRDSIGKNDFLYIEWADMLDAGYKVVIWESAAEELAS